MVNQPDQILKGFQLNEEGVLDAWEGPYNSIDEVLLKIPYLTHEPIRRNGRKVKILTSSGYEEWWWKNGTTDDDLVPYVTEGTTPGGGTPTPVNSFGSIYTASGDGIATVFKIPHGQTNVTPTKVSVKEASLDANDDYYITVDSTHITLNYFIAPKAGTNNLSWYWTVLTSGSGGVYTTSGNNRTSLFLIPHGLGSKPAKVSVIEGSVDASDRFYVSSDNINIAIQYELAPKQGINNLTWFWTS